MKLTKGGALLLRSLASSRLSVPRGPALPGKGLELGAEQVVEDVDDGGDISFRLPIRVLGYFSM